MSIVGKYLLIQNIFNKKKTAHIPPPSLTIYIRNIVLRIVRVWMERKRHGEKVGMYVYTVCIYLETNVKKNRIFVDHKKKCNKFNC